MIVGGMVTDRVAVRTGNPARARKAMIVGGLIVTAVLFAGIDIVTTAWSAVGLMSAVLFMLYLTTAQYFALIADVVAQPRLGSVMGFVQRSPTSPGSSPRQSSACSSAVPAHGP